jgi:hypothetical protein
MGLTRKKETEAYMELEMQNGNRVGLHRRQHLDRSIIKLGWSSRSQQPHPQLQSLLQPSLMKPEPFKRSDVHLSVAIKILP